MNISVNFGCYVQNLFIPFNVEIIADEKYYRNLKKLLRVDRMKDFMFRRIGKANDGGYIMVNDFDFGDKIVYSFGMTNDVSWEDSLADNDFELFIYDKSADYPSKSRKAFHFFKEGLADKCNPEENVNTLDSFISANNHEENQNMILKINLNGTEWDVLNKVKPDTFEQFDQILIKFHNLVRAGDEKAVENRLSALKKINKTHQLVHIHGNNSGYYLYVDGVLYPDVIEATYVKKSKYTTYEDDAIFLPNSLDEPCDMHRGDLVLGYWNRD